MRLRCQEMSLKYLVSLVDIMYMRPISIYPCERDLHSLTFSNFYFLVDFACCHTTVEYTRTYRQTGELCLRIVQEYYKITRTPMYLRSKSLSQWYINTIIMFLDVTQHPISYLKHKVSETGCCIHLQVKAYSFGPNRES
jgi:hypothetical protein